MLGDTVLHLLLMPCHLSRPDHFQCAWLNDAARSFSFISAICAFSLRCGSPRQHALFAVVVQNNSGIDVRPPCPACKTPGSPKSDRLNFRQFCREHKTERQHFRQICRKQNSERQICFFWTPPRIDNLSFLRAEKRQFVFFRASKKDNLSF